MDTISFNREEQKFINICKSIVNPIIKTLASPPNKIQCAIVGGFNRDKLLGKAPNDIDLVVNSFFFQKFVRSLQTRLDDMTDCEVLSFKTIVLTNPIKNRKELFRFVISIDGKNIEIDITSVDGLTFKADAYYRDFTINSIYYDLTRDTLIDPLGGQIDLKDKLIKTCAEPMLAFKDPTRVIRAFRLAKILEYSIEKPIL